MLNEIDEHVALIPEKNQLQHTKFMFKLQTQHFLEQIEEKKRTMKYYEQQYANQFDKNSPNAQLLLKKIEEYKQHIQAHKNEVLKL